MLAKKTDANYEEMKMTKNEEMKMTKKGKGQKGARHG
jgi:hypothetical protein